MKLVLISDTHLTKPTLPEGDLLIHAGDLTFDGSITQTTKGLNWLGTQGKNYKYGVIFVPGNHDWLFQNDFALAKKLGEENKITLLLDSSIVLENKRFYGSPWQPEFCNWAFNVPRFEEIRKKWDMIPLDTNVLITHGPPKGFNDFTSRGENVGCEELLQKVLTIKPELHIFGHIHSGYGESFFNGTHFVNASICNEKYQPLNKPVVVDL